MRKYLLAAIMAAIALTASAQSPIKVSLINLIATPERFDGKVVWVEGYMHDQFEDQAVYLSKEDGDHWITSNAIWVVETENTKVEMHPSMINSSKSKKPHFETDHSYVSIIGTFNMGNRGHFGLYAGELNQVSRIQGLPNLLSASKRRKQ